VCVVARPSRGPTGDGSVIAATGQEEAKQLEKQGQFLAPLTRRLFEDAGITTGMKVLV
jgi:hypothetical protein